MTIGECRTLLYTKGEMIFFKRPIYFISIFLFGTLVGCVDLKQSATSSPTDSSSSSDSNRAVFENENPLIQGTVSMPRQGQLFSFTPQLAPGVSLEIINKPSELNFNPVSGQISGIFYEIKTVDDIKIIARRDNTFTELGPFSLSVQGDPLFTQQWHLRNTAQSGFSRGNGIAGNDLSMIQAIRDGLSGKGVKVAVSDTGLDYSQPDLIANILFNQSKNYELNAPFFGDPIPPSTQGDHGTSVAGIIAAAAWNNEGGRGVAPEAKVAGLKFIGVNTPDATIALLDQADGDFDIFNYSYGAPFSNGRFSYDFTYRDQIRNGHISNRNTYVKSAGNEFKVCDVDFSNAFNFGGRCFSHESTTDPENNISYMTIVSALNARGQLASYSSFGSNVWVSAFGGEFGVEDPAIVTTDDNGCGQGFSRSNTSYPLDFDRGRDLLNKNCDYTHRFNGTSSSAPMVSGVAALLLEKNTSLRPREIKHILAMTADKINSSDTGRSHPFGMDLSEHIYDPGWVTNGAGVRFHNFYGFGRVNVDAAVSMASSFVSNLGTSQEINSEFTETSLKKSTGGSIPDNSATGLSESINVSNVLTIEAVQIKVNLTHKRPGDIGIELTSPSGTRSVLLHINSAFLIATESNSKPVWVADFSDYVLSSNAFYGESATGQWTIKVIDGQGNTSSITGMNVDNASDQQGNLVDWSINIIGH
jgi:subtilisin family serine protease